MNSAYRDLLESRAASAVAAAKAMARVNHAGLRGQFREIVVRDFLAPLLPVGIGIGRGHVVTSYDEQSPEQDVILYDRSLVPSILIDATAGLFPLEAVLYTIEVKSRVTAAELLDSHKKAKATEVLQHRPGNGVPEHIIPCLFAFETDLTPDGKTEIERYSGILNGAKPSIRSICVPGRGYWFWTEPTGWVKAGGDLPSADMLWFVAGILDTYQRVAATRSRPSLRDYVG